MKCWRKATIPTILLSRMHCGRNTLKTVVLARDDLIICGDARTSVFKVFLPPCMRKKRIIGFLAFRQYFMVQSVGPSTQLHNVKKVLINGGQWLDPTLVNLGIGRQNMGNFRTHNKSDQSVQIWAKDDKESGFCSYTSFHKTN